jgi:hypothetical protein
MLKPGAILADGAYHAAAVTGERGRAVCSFELARLGDLRAGW